jgi:serine/threonine-protein kinase PpkA
MFVMDMTCSMQPYIDATLQVIKNMALSITKDADTRASVSFGLWGYRDSPDIPGLEFLTKNFTPELQPVDQFEATLSGVKAALVGSEDYAEDVFSGVEGHA